MARYIDADKLIEKGWHLERHAPDGRCITLMSLADVPEADVVEVKDCTKCKHFFKDDAEHPCNCCKNCYTNKFEPKKAVVKVKHRKRR